MPIAAYDMVFVYVVNKYKIEGNKIFEVVCIFAIEIFYSLKKMYGYLIPYADNIDMDLKRHHISSDYATCIPMTKMSIIELAPSWRTF